MRIDAAPGPGHRRSPGPAPSARHAGTAGGLLGDGQDPAGADGAAGVAPSGPGESEGTQEDALVGAGPATAEPLGATGLPVARRDPAATAELRAPPRRPSPSALTGAARCDGVRPADAHVWMDRARGLGPTRATGPPTGTCSNSWRPSPVPRPAEVPAGQPAAPSRQAPR
ncbi:hypothetical protein GCM10010358_13420 [Streptomyces minutiscleroticus]|uniref:Uncharacterized protein n=1 Tax=Streptomyces minutiscleroticus TaxID=68238 RepID=A0A918NDM3_9ACTN|nr:hypothetical protein GCM10010358_13420 [Streptomyces minutiscleroticus]